jgi:hypothetical protein
MSSSSIVIRRHPYEEPRHLNLVISATHGGFAGTLDYYCSATDLVEIGTRLMAFPERTGDNYVYERGSTHPEDRWAYYFSLRAFTVDSSGHCALQITMNNNASRPDACACLPALHSD